jgi:3-oxoacyl-[acyl-carrier-protein] synthase II
MTLFLTDIRQNVVPPTLNLENPSAGFEFNYVPREAQEKIVNVSVSNSFGFGGTNASLVFAKHGYKK